jgi:hypothetical protein
VERLPFSCGGRRRPAWLSCNVSPGPPVAAGDPTSRMRAWVRICGRAICFLHGVARREACWRQARQAAREMCAPQQEQGKLTGRRPRGRSISARAGSSAASGGAQVDVERILASPTGLAVWTGGSAAGGAAWARRQSEGPRWMDGPLNRPDCVNQSSGQAGGNSNHFCQIYPTQLLLPHEASTASGSLISGGSQRSNRCWAADGQPLQGR